MDQHELVDATDDIMPASFVLALMASMALGIAMWCLAISLLR